ncbi:MAG: hypothetical protein LBM66_04400, partial [Bifidobacteriaceae bacterium]|nr:hypothetical protein [Bifidobacteriaceae bacterium]
PNRAAPILVIGGGLVVVIAVVALVVGLWHGHSTPAPAALATTSQTAQAGHTASASAQPADTATDQPTAPSQTAAPTATGGATATTTAQPAPAGTESVDPATGCPKVVSMFDSGYTGETPYRDPSKLSAFQTTACLTSAITDLKKYSNTNAVGDEVWAVVSIRDDDAFYRVRQDSSKYWWFCVRGDSLDDCIKDDNDGRFDTMVPFHLSDIDPAAMGKVLALAPQRIAAKGLTGVTDIRLSVTAAKADAGGAAVAPASAITLRLQIEAANGNDTSKYTVTGAPKP